MLLLTPKLFYYPIIFIFNENSTYGRKSLLEVIRQNIAGWCQQTFCFHKFVDNILQCNVLPLLLNQTFLPIIWRWSNGIKSRLPFKIFSTLHCTYYLFELQQVHSNNIVMGPKVFIKYAKNIYIFKVLYCWKSEKVMAKYRHIINMTSKKRKRSIFHGFW